MICKMQAVATTALVLFLSSLLWCNCSNPPICAHLSSEKQQKPDVYRAESELWRSIRSEVSQALARPRHGTEEGEELASQTSNRRRIGNVNGKSTAGRPGLTESHLNIAGKEARKHVTHDQRISVLLEDLLPDILSSPVADKDTAAGVDCA